MKHVLMIPDRSRLEESLKTASEYGAGFEYNDFFAPDILEDEKKRKDALAAYKAVGLPEYCTLHGAFYDVIPFSPDVRIREVAALRIGQSIDVAGELNAKAVVFHTSYNPALNSEAYVKQWIEQNVMFWGEVLEKHPGINIYLENTFETTPVLFEKMSEELGRYENYGVCLDYAHACLSKTAPEEWAKRLGPFVKHIHINDNDGASDLHQAWGDGTLNRETFYRCYETWLQGATVLVETGKIENTIRSFCRLKEEGFLR